MSQASMDSALASLRAMLADQAIGWDSILVSAVELREQLIRNPAIDEMQDLLLATKKIVADAQAGQLRQRELLTELERFLALGEVGQALNFADSLRSSAHCGAMVEQLPTTQAINIKRNGSTVVPADGVLMRSMECHCLKYSEIYRLPTVK